MTTGDLGRRAETLGRQRWWAMTALVAGWIMWMFVTLKPVQTLPLLRDVSSDGFFFGGLAIYGAALVWLATIVVKIKHDRMICGILNDELTRANEQRAYAFGYFVLLASLLLFAAAEVFGFVAPRTVLIALVTIGAGAPLLARVWLERDAAK